MKIKVIATDIDGTLVDSNKKMPEDFFDWVKEHDRVKFVIASGRQYYALKRDFEPIHDRLIYIAENGGLIFQNDEIIHCDEIPKEDVLYCLDLIDKMPYAKAVPCGAKSAYIENPDEHEWNICTMFCGRLEKTDNVRLAIENDRIVKIAIYYRGEDAELHTGDFEALPEHIISVLSGVSWIDISKDTVNKGAAMKVIQKRLGIEKQFCMAFGDYLNDVELLEACEESYCMANGHPEVFKHAKYTAPSNDENGVMQILRKGSYEF